MGGTILHETLSIFKRRSLEAKIRGMYIMKKNILELIFAYHPLEVKFE